MTKQLLTAFTTWLPGRINSVRQEGIITRTEKNSQPLMNVNSGLPQYLYLYLFSSLLAVTLECALNMFTFSGSVRASKTLFREMTFKVIRMPILWLDTKPIGELLRGFTVDVKTVDEWVFPEISSFADCVFKLLTVVGVG